MCVNRIYSGALCPVSATAHRRKRYLKENQMNKLVIAGLTALLVTGTAFAETPVGGEGCEARAVSKEGKPLAGAAKSAFMKKCERESKIENKTDDVRSAKIAQQEKMKECNKEGVGKKGEERKKFMSECLKK